MENFQQIPSGTHLPFRVGIVGGGRLGGALARALEPYLAWVVTRSPARRAFLRSVLQGAALVGSLKEIAVLPPVVIIAVPDRAIIPVAEECARQFAGQLEGKVVIHLAGSLLAQVLEPVQQFGALIAAAHPFTVVPEPHPGWIYGAVWGIEGDYRAFDRTERLVVATGGIPYRLGSMNAERKALYHVAAVLASNVTTHAIAAAVQAAEAAGIPPAVFLPPILRATVESATSALLQGQPVQRTGPLVRGDDETIERHLRALEQYPLLLAQYKAFLAAMLHDAP
ncbi:MAG: DUF2520 domain-containing protein [Bacteroidota bacterium]|nr:DUF2520 domain-containing protein [Candidatus Kapabacteria bacterium]MCS7302502.1 DUF2520 domain-containing protein [Candidatus Kapabacteria bacterium]MCX7937279.1 DUF2520 domain-containing protein [Chlorobiota bacterium]MDW8075542.1 DUF2520 domain-containing protein [Bacteroidota bacterium]